VKVTVSPGTAVVSLDPSDVVVPAALTTSVMDVDAEPLYVPVFPAY
jgi:hypothetical protein